MHLHEEIIGGLTAGIAGTSIGYPLDLIKTRLQCSGKKCSLLAILYGIIQRGIWHNFLLIIFFLRGGRNQHFPVFLSLFRHT